MLTVASIVLFAGCAGLFAQRPPAPGGDADPGYVEIYDVRDLALPSALRRLVPRENEPALQNRAGAAAGAGSGADAAIAKLLREQARSKEGERDAVTSDLAAWKLLETLVQCVAARGGGPATCQANENGALVVHATRDTHRAIDDLLKSVRRCDESLTVELRVLELDVAAQALLEGFAAGRADAANGVAAAPAGAPVTSPTQEELERLLAHAGTRVLAAPSVVTPELDGFEVEIAVPTAYVASFVIHSIEGIGTVTEPVIKEARPGTRVRGRCVEAPGANAAPGGAAPPFALALEVEVAELRKPIAVQKTGLGTIQLPELKRAMISTTVAGAAERPLLIGGVPKPAFDAEEATHRLYVLVTVGARRRGG
jgi:hypothetical protein